MEQIAKKYGLFALLASTVLVHTGQQPQQRSMVPSLIKVRPQSLNGARKVAGETPGVVTHVQGMDGYYANKSIAVEGQRTFRPREITQLLFDGFAKTTPANMPSSRCKTMCDAQTILVQGTSVPNRDPSALLAKNLYLAPEFSSVLSFKPTITNVMVDFNYFGGLSNWVDGLYFRVYAPFVHTRWNLHMHETIVTRGDATMANGRVPMLTSAAEFFAGNTPANTALPTFVPNNAGNGFVTDTLPLTRNPLLYHTMGIVPKDELCSRKCSQGNTRNGFGELRAEFGWDFLQDCDYHVGAYLAAAAPTGNKPNARLLFSPLIGNGRHWELGGGVSAHWVFWKSENELHSSGVYFDTMVTHLFKSRERRVFDLKNNPLSRYLNAARMTTVVTNSLRGAPAGGQPVSASVQFANEYMPVANLTAQDINVSIAAQVDLTAWINYTGNMFAFDFGYNMWLQTCERFSCVSTCGPRLGREKNTWVLAGDAIAYGINTPILNENSRFFPLPFSVSNATISSGANMSDPRNNADIDKPQPAQILDIGIAPAAYHALNSPATGVATPINLSNPPIFLSTADIDMKQQAASKLSHKVFVNMGYKWDWCENITPSFNIGGEAEFGSGINKCQPAKSDCAAQCANSALSQWGVWAKLNCAFR